MADPTGKDVDDINPESLLIETDHALVMHLGITHDIHAGGEKVKVKVFEVDSSNIGEGTADM